MDFAWAVAGASVGSTGSDSGAEVASDSSNTQVSILKAERGFHIARVNSKLAYASSPHCTWRQIVKEPCLLLSSGISHLTWSLLDSSRRLAHALSTRPLFVADPPPLHVPSPCSMSRRVMTEQCTVTSRRVVVLIRACMGLCMAVANPFGAFTGRGTGPKGARPARFFCFFRFIS